MDDAETKKLIILVSDSSTNVSALKQIAEEKRLHFKHVKKLSEVTLEESANAVFLATDARIVVGDKDANLFSQLLPSTQSQHEGIALANSLDKYSLLPVLVINANRSDGPLRAVWIVNNLHDGNIKTEIKAAISTYLSNPKSLGDAMKRETSRLPRRD